jgi:very-short-patch-repair endonuclease
LLPGIYRDASVPDSAALRAHAALLYAGDGARFSHTTAAAIFGIDVGPQPDIHVTVPYERAVRDQRWVITHRSRQLVGANVTTRRKLPATSASRTVLDLGTLLTRPALDSALADAIRGGHVTAGYVARRLRQVAGGGAKGVLIRVLKDFDPLMESILEREYAAVVMAAGLPVGRTQHEISDGPLLIARVDFAHVERRLVVEIDGYAYHSPREQFQRDRRRDSALNSRGWEVLRFVADDVRRRPAQMVEELRARLAKVQLPAAV